MTKTKAGPARTPRRTRRQAREVIDLLLEAATEEFKRFGFTAATTAEIARRAHTTEAQLFRYFGTKANLFRETVFNQLDRHFAEFNARTPSHGSPQDLREAGRAYIAELHRFLSDHAGLLLSLMVAQTYAPGASPGLNEIDHLRTYFERGAAIVARTSAGAPLPIPPELLVRVSFAAVLANVLFKQWLFPLGLSGDDAIEQAVIDFVLDGISSDLPSGGAYRSGNAMSLD